MTADLALVLAILMAFAFALTNGFPTRRTRSPPSSRPGSPGPLPAVALASVFNLLGPLFFGAAVANTVGKLVTVDPAHTVPVIGAGPDRSRRLEHVSPGGGACRRARAMPWWVVWSARRS